MELQQLKRLLIEGPTPSPDTITNQLNIVEMKRNRIKEKVATSSLGNTKVTYLRLLSIGEVKRMQMDINVEYARMGS